jgi:hypothetical protein
MPMKKQRVAAKGKKVEKKVPAKKGSKKEY